MCDRIAISVWQRKGIGSEQFVISIYVPNLSQDDCAYMNSEISCWRIHYCHAQKSFHLFAIKLYDIIIRQQRLCSLSQFFQKKMSQEQFSSCLSHCWLEYFWESRAPKVLGKTIFLTFVFKTKASIPQPQQRRHNTHARRWLRRHIPWGFIEAKPEMNVSIFSLFFLWAKHIGISEWLPIWIMQSVFSTTPKRPKMQNESGWQGTGNEKFHYKSLFMFLLAHSA